MTTLSQGKKIALTAVAIFSVSLTMLIIFLDESKYGLHNGSASVMTSHKSSHGEEAETPSHEEGAAEYQYLGDILEEQAAFVTSPEGKLLEVNEAFCELLDRQCESFKDSSIFDYVNSKDISELAGVHGKIVHDGAEFDGLGPYRMLKNNKEIMLLFDAIPSIGESEKVENIIFRVKDITEKVEQLNSSKKESDAEVEEVKEVDSKESWVEQLYPKVEEKKGEADDKLLVNKTA